MIEESQERAYDGSNDSGAVYPKLELNSNIIEEDWGSLCSLELVQSKAFFP